MSQAAAPSRRARLRAQTLSEIREHGYAQITEGGPTALSLNGIAKAMGMSGAAMYRYFASRDELLTTLVTESYEDLAETLEQVAHRARRRAPESRLRAALEGLRDWALAHPHRYRLVFGSAYGSGELDPERIIPAAHRAMGVTWRPSPSSNPATRGPPSRTPFYAGSSSAGAKAGGRPRRTPASSCVGSPRGPVCTGS